MLSQLLNRPCTITRRSATGPDDGYGNATTAETTVATVCELQRRDRADAEPGGQGEFSDTFWLLVLPAGTAIDSSDIVTVDGETYEMFGDAWAVRNPRTETESHVEATVRRTAGAEDGS